jgi:hypothetical protein
MAQLSKGKSTTKPALKKRTTRLEEVLTSLLKIRATKRNSSKTAKTEAQTIKGLLTFLDKAPEIGYYSFFNPPTLPGEL